MLQKWIKSNFLMLTFPACPTLGTFNHTVTYHGHMCKCRVANLPSHTCSYLYVFLAVIWMQVDLIPTSRHLWCQTYWLDPGPYMQQIWTSPESVLLTSFYFLPWLQLLLLTPVSSSKIKPTDMFQWQGGSQLTVLGPTFL